MTLATRCQPFSLTNVHPSWRPHLTDALAQMDQTYLDTLYHDTHWLPGHAAIFNAFSISLSNTRYILFGESPYPRAASANGYAFWDAAVTNLWSDTGLSKQVNRATSLRNILKMLLIAEGLLTANDTSQTAIAAINKTPLITTGADFFKNFLRNGFLLLNATPVFRVGRVREDARAWQPFIAALMQIILRAQPNIQLLLFGRVAAMLTSVLQLRLGIQTDKICQLQAEHPYNLSFVHHDGVLNFFRPLHLLLKRSTDSA